MQDVVFRHVKSVFPAFGESNCLLAAKAQEASVEKVGSAAILLRARSGAASPGSSGFRCGDALRRPGSKAARL